MRTTIDALATAILVIVGLNCGLIALFQYDPLTTGFEASIGVTASRLFLGLVGAAALYRIISVLEPERVAVYRSHLR
jgi:uncharacterized membrane protein YuzA (DUF378 family)